MFEGHEEFFRIFFGSVMKSWPKSTTKVQKTKLIYQDVIISKRMCLCFFLKWWWSEELWSTFLFGTELWKLVAFLWCVKEVGEKPLGHGRCWPVSVRLLFGKKIRPSAWLQKTFGAWLVFWVMGEVMGFNFALSTLWPWASGPWVESLMT